MERPEVEAKLVDVLVATGRTADAALENAVLIELLEAGMGPDDPRLLEPLRPSRLRAAASEAHVLLDGEVGKQGGVLRHPAERAALGPNDPQVCLAVDPPGGRVLPRPAAVAPPVPEGSHHPDEVIDGSEHARGLLLEGAHGGVELLPASGGLNLHLGNNPDRCRTLTTRPGLWRRRRGRPLPLNPVSVGGPTWRRRPRR